MTWNPIRPGKAKQWVGKLKRPGMSHAMTLHAAQQGLCNR